MRISLGCDHRGWKAIDELIPYLRGTGHEVVELGMEDDADRSCDYPDRAWLVANAVSRGESDRGILVCGTGIGMCIAANKVAGVRAALALDELSARFSRSHNDANILSIGARFIFPDDARKMVRIWLETKPNSDPKYARRIQKAEGYPQT